MLNHEHRSFNIGSFYFHRMQRHVIGIIRRNFVDLAPNSGGHQHGTYLFGIGQCITNSSLRQYIIVHLCFVLDVVHFSLRKQAHRHREPRLRSRQIPLPHQYIQSYGWSLPKFTHSLNPYAMVFQRKWNTSRFKMVARCSCIQRVKKAVQDYELFRTFQQGTAPFAYFTRQINYSASSLLTRSIVAR